jgi:hypothetical protein
MGITHSQPKYAIFGTGLAADEAFEFARSKNYYVSVFIDDFRMGTHKGLPVVSWEEFLVIQHEYCAIIIGKYQKGDLQSRRYLTIPLIVAPYPIDSSLGIENTKKLLSYKDKHKNKRCFIIGNGPSLNLKDLEKLNGEYSFASNKIYLIYSETVWRPSFYFVEDMLVAENNSTIINELQSEKFLEYSTLKFLNHANSSVFFHIDSPLPIFRNVMHGLGVGRSVTAAQLQFAKYMGFTEVYMIGMDFHFTLPDNSSVNQETLVSTGECNHFHPEYRKAGETWSFPDLESQKQFFDYTAKYVCNDNFKVFNASRFSKLDSFPRVDFDSLF